MLGMPTSCASRSTAAPETESPGPVHIAPGYVWGGRTVRAIRASALDGLTALAIRRSPT